MSKTFKGRPVVAGKIDKGEAIVSHNGVNTLATFQKTALLHDIPLLGKDYVIGSDQNNPDVFGKNLTGKVLCLPQTIGSTTGGMVLYCAKVMERNPACMLFSEHIDSLACAGAVLGAVWTDSPMPVIDCLGDEFLSYVKDGMKITVAEDGTVTVE